MKKLIALFLFLVSTPALASPCDKLFPNGQEVTVANTVVLCNTHFATVYDDARNATIFSTEIAQARLKKTPRTDDFRADKRISDSPTPADYTNTGYDRGHMAAAANADDPVEMSETFLMTNMTPQLPNINRVIWKNIEERTRTLPFTYIITGATYPANPKVLGKNKVPVPSALYKIVYFADGKHAVYYVLNQPGAKLESPPLTHLRTLTGINFPG